ncbi:MAG TPA: antibiotic biosynthesis monooxygenase family protein [Candidatus Polarisedimenticolaceae bacterium]
MSGHARLWQFDVPPDRQAEFERVYGATGRWAVLFRRAPGYRGTILLRDRSVPNRYVTIDRWRSEADFEAFRQRYATEYEALDAACEALTEREALLGIFDEDEA